MASTPMTGRGGEMGGADEHIPSMPTIVPEGHDWNVLCLVCGCTYQSTQPFTDLCPKCGEDPRDGAREG